MKHYLNVCDVNGAEVAPVDVITFGSPCQDLSVAGKRAGMKHEAHGDEETTRSGLFMEAVRIIKEMRAKTNGMYPTYAIWENVPGAFSSQKGADFAAVLDALISIVEPQAPGVDVPEKGWPNYGGFRDVDGRWSVAWRVFDAQYWGVPQRRRRILLVADFAGGRAGEILFERYGVQGDSAKGGEAGQGAAGNAADCAGADDRRCIITAAGFKANQGEKAGGIGWQAETACTLGANVAGLEPTVCVQYLFENHSQDARYKGPLDTCQMLPAQLGTGGNNTPFVVRQCIQINDKATRHMGGGNSRNHDGSGNGLGVGADGDPSPTLTGGDRHAVCYSETYQQTTGQLMANSHPGSYCGQDAYQDMLVVGKECYQNTGRGWWNHTDVGATVRTACGGDSTKANIVVECAGVDCRNLNEYPQLYPTLQAKPNGGQSLNFSGAVRIRYIVRRLTPTECARLQGFPDWWGELPTITDMTDEQYQFWCAVLLENAKIDQTARWDAQKQRYAEWRQIKPGKDEDFEPYWIDTGKPYKDKPKPQMISWYNKLRTDSAEYKMWGNGVALPVVRFPLRGMARYGARTLGSLFDGSGGFPLAGVLEGITPLWASEIEPYPIAVTVERFGVLL